MSREHGSSFVIIVVALFAALWGCCPSFAEVVRIHPAVATQDEEFEKLANSLKPGDQLILHAGLYSQNGRRAVTAKGTPQKPIIIRAADGEQRPLLTRPEDNIDKHNNIEFVDCEYLVVKGLRFKGGSSGVRFIRGRHVTFEDCEIAQTGNNALTMNSGSCDSFTIRRNHIHHTGLSTRGPTEGEGMYIGSHDGKYITTNTMIEGNYIHDTRSTSNGGNDGIEIKYGSYDNVVRDNVIHATKYGRKYPGIFVYGGGRGVNIVEGNLIFDAGEGIQVVSDAIIRNNIIVDCLMTGITAAPHSAVPKMKNVKIINNTIINNPTGIRIRWKNADKMVFANNAVYSPATTAIDAAGIDNSIFSSNCVTGQLRGIKIDGKAFIAGRGDKDFQNFKAYDLRPPKGSTLLGAADQTYIPPDDFDNNKRQEPFEIGAYEISDQAIKTPLPHKGGFKEPRNNPQKSVKVSNTNQLRSAIAQAQPGTRILLANGIFEGGIYINGLSGTKENPIIITGLDPDKPPVFSGGPSQAFHLANCNHIVLSNFIVRGFSSNGINIDDGGTFKTPSEYIKLTNVSIFDTGPKGNHDALKMSGVDHFVVDNCHFEGWGGSGIDMVGCHKGEISLCTFQGRENFSQSNAIQMKGGTTSILVRQNLFKDVGHRAINCGGSTGLEYFRPKVDDYEAKEITIAGNTFIGGITPIAWATSNGGWFHHNTIILPEKWVARILQENTDKRFNPCKNGIFENNLIVYDKRVSVFVNVGPGVAGNTFTFRRNAWCPVENAPKPSLPTPEKDGLYSQELDQKKSDLSKGRVVVKNTKAQTYGAQAYKP